MNRTWMTMLLIALIGPAILCAHEGHVHEAALEAPPHGGLLRDAGHFKAELVLNGENARIYIYDKTLKTVAPANEKIEGKVQLPRKKPVRIEFKRSGDHYEGTIKGIAKAHRYDLHVNLNIAGGDVIADFGVDNIQ